MPLFLRRPRRVCQRITRSGCPLPEPPVTPPKWSTPNWPCRCTNSQEHREHRLCNRHVRQPPLPLVSQALHRLCTTREMPTSRLMFHPLASVFGHDLSYQRQTLQKSNVRRCYDNGDNYASPIAPVSSTSAELLFQMDLARSTQQPSNLATASHWERCIQLRDIIPIISNQRPQHNSCRCCKAIRC